MSSRSRKPGTGQKPPSKVSRSEVDLLYHDLAALRHSAAATDLRGRGPQASELCTDAVEVVMAFGAAEAGLQRASRGGRTRTCNPRFWRRAVFGLVMRCSGFAPHSAPQRT
jgi:hypothetical protein